jgi:cell division protein FtsZ
MNHGTEPSVRNNLLLFGIGGAGMNSVSRIKDLGIPGIKYATIGTSNEPLHGISHLNLLDNHSSISGCGADASLGEGLAKQRAADIRKILNGNDIVVISAGLGRGTGAGATKFVANQAKRMGLISIGVFTIPFSFEGKQRRSAALQALAEIEPIFDCTMVMHNDHLLEIKDNLELTMQEAFHKADIALEKVIRLIHDLTKYPGFSITTCFKRLLRAVNTMLICLRKGANNDLDTNG